MPVYEPEEALKAVDDVRIDIIQIPYNVLDKRLDRVGFFTKAKKHNKEIPTANKTQIPIPIKNDVLFLRISAVAL